jgi:hypothetical protein
MVERASVFQTVQVGPEASGSPGVAVAADTKLLAMGFSPSPSMNFQSFTPMGTKYPTLQALIQEFSESGVEGYPTYTEIVYPLSSVVDDTTPSTTSGVTTWVFSSNPDAADSPVTYTIERGGGGQAERMTYGIMDEFSVNFSRTDAGMGGHLIARALETGITLTAAPTSVNLVPITPDDWDVYLSPRTGTFLTADFEAAQLMRCRNFTFSIGGRYGPLWVLNSSLTSFAAIVELAPDARVEFTVQADATGMAQFASARAGTKKLMRFKATGPIIGATATAHLFQIDCVITISNIANLGDQDGVYKLDVTGMLTRDATWAKAFEITVKNDVTAL